MVYNSRATARKMTETKFVRVGPEDNFAFMHYNLSHTNTTNLTYSSPGSESGLSLRERKEKNIQNG